MRRLTLSIAIFMAILVPGMPSVHAAGCTKAGLQETLQMKAKTFEDRNLSEQTWWTQCPLSVRQAVWNAALKGPTTEHGEPYQQGSTTPLPYLGKAPEFAGLEHWYNSAPLDLTSLRGKVVLVHFWTFGCINCIHTLPSIKKYWNEYQGTGKFEVVGIHSPEFAYEKVLRNVANAIKDRGLTYPIATDNDFKTWSAFGNQYWPAIYLIDEEGNIRYTHFGEGDYDKTDAAIQQLIDDIR